MSAQHTPGDWQVSNIDRTTVCDSNGIPITWGARHGLRDKSEAYANARLIAAATDLLADLRLAVETLRHYEDLHRAKGTAESTVKAEANALLASRLEATIAKATWGPA